MSEKHAILLSPTFAVFSAGPNSVTVPKRLFTGSLRAAATVFTLPELPAELLIQDRHYDAKAVPGLGVAYVLRGFDLDAWLASASR